jgi:hypothetical protein
MIAYDTLRTAWRDERARRLSRYHRLPALAESGLVLGADTVIAKRAIDRWGGPDLALKDNEARILALLAVAYWRPVSPAVLGHLRRAAKALARGEAALAGIHVAHAGLEKLDQDEGIAFRLFAAERLLDAGVSPRDLMAGLGLDPWPLDMLKANFDPDEPRDDHGRWTEGGPRSDAEANDGSDADMDRVHPQFVADGGTGGLKAKAQASHGIVEIVRADGSIEIRTGGTPAWRNNNPGNIRFLGTFARNHGAIGRDDNGFAIFPDEATGEAALKSEMKETGYASKTIDQFVARRSPPEENDTPHIQAMVRAFSGLPGNAIVGQLNDDQLGRLSAAIRRTEGWRVGTVQRSTKA